MLLALLKAQIIKDEFIFFKVYVHTLFTQVFALTLYVFAQLWKLQPFDHSITPSFIYFLCYILLADLPVASAFVCKILIW